MLLRAVVHCGLTGASCAGAGAAARVLAPVSVIWRVW